MIDWQVRREAPSLILLMWELEEKLQQEQDKNSFKSQLIMWDLAKVYTAISTFYQQKQAA